MLYSQNCKIRAKRDTHLDPSYELTVKIHDRQNLSQPVSPLKSSKTTVWKVQDFSATLILRETEIKRG